MFVLLSTVLFTGCATDMGSRSYSDDHVGEAARTYRGVIVNIREVKVGPDQLGKNRSGAVAGGLAGGLIGSRFGGGSGKTLLTLGGAVAGAVGGAFAEKALKTQKAYELVIELKNGALMTVVQGTDVQFQAGQRVLLMVSVRGRSKVVPEAWSSAN